MESLGTGRKGAQRGRKRQEGAQRGRKGLSPFLPPVPSDSIAGPPKKGKKSLAGVS